MNWRQRITRLYLAASVLAGAAAFGAEPVELAREGKERSIGQIEPVTFNGQPAIAAVFAGTSDLHYYATAKSAPAEGMELKVGGQADGVTFAKMILPTPKSFYNPAEEKNIDVFVGNFEVILPITSGPESGIVDVNVTITGLACTSRICLPPFKKTLTASIDFAGASSWRTITRQIPAAISTNVAGQVVEGGFGTGWALLLAVLAGLSFNIMPCVLPVIPLIMSKLMSQSQEKAGQRIGLGLAFCGGMILFFAVFAAAAILIKAATGAAFNWGDQLRYPSFVLGMGLFLVAFGLFMFDVFGVSIPSSMTGGGTSGGLAGSAGMGFLAALLSTPCSGAILAAVLVWAQTQNAAMSLAAFLLMGLGMAAPYAAMVLAPGLLNKLPRPGDWMEHFRKAMGFVLLIIAVKLLGALPKERLVDALFYAVVLSFCLWMWGSWVNFATPVGKKWTTRMVAVLIAAIAGLWLLPEQTSLVDWKPYDAATIQKAVEQKRPVVIKFTADWCTNCVVVDKRVYHNQEVADLIKQKNVLAIKADTTSNDMPATAAQVEVYGESGTVPVTVVILPGKEPIKLRGIFDKRELIEILEK